MKSRKGRIMSWLSRLLGVAQNHERATGVKKNKILVLVDLENILRNPKYESSDFSLREAFLDLMKKLGAIGVVQNIFVFAPEHLIPRYLEVFYRLRIFPIPCPKVKRKGEENPSDTVDEVLKEFGQRMIGQDLSATHLCLCSGDTDFIPLLQEAIRHGLKIIIISGNLKSLGMDLIINFADRDPNTGQKMVYSFGTPKEE